MDYSSRQYVDEINELRIKGNLIEAINLCNDAISAFPKDDFFYEILGDLYFQQKNYRIAFHNYLEQLKLLEAKPEHFKSFARVYQQVMTEAPESVSNQFYHEIIKAIKSGQIAPKIHQILVKIFGYPFITDDNLKEILHKSNNNHNVNEIKEFVESTSADNIYSIILYQIQQKEEAANAEIIKYLISVAEKRELYTEAQKLIEKIIVTYSSPDPILIRALLRTSRKQQNYDYAEQLIKIDEELIKKSDFNIQYELVYYFAYTNNEELLNKTLKKMRTSAEHSIPIAKTLYNFYLTYDRFEDAQALSEHIQKLFNQKKYAEKNKYQLQNRNQEQLESEQAVWQRIKDLVSEKEHNRQMLALRDLLRGFSHELGQPITNIRYKIQLQQLRMEHKMGTIDEINDLFVTILDQTERIGSMLERFRPIVSSKSIQESFNVNDCIKQVFDDLAVRLNQNNITYSLIEKSQVSLFGDKIQFSQIFYNLILNSMQAIVTNGKITVKILTNKNFMVILFSDNGPGIPEENKKKIFEPFFSTKDPSSGNGGEGLGLFVVWNILKMYKGTIQLLTHHTKDGAQFKIKIPIEEKKHE